MTLETLVSKILNDFKNSGNNISPDEFKKAFCKELKKAGVTHSDCEKISKYSTRLGENYQKLVKNYNVKDEDEFFQFLLSQLNRLDPAETEAYLESQMALIVRVLKAIMLLKNKDATNLAKTTIDRIENYKSLEAIANLKQKWDEFNANYSDNYLDTLSKFCIVRKGSLEHVVDDIKLCFEKMEFNTEELALLLSESLKPSISKAIDSDVKELSVKIVENPSLLKLRKTQKDIKSMIGKRIFVDNKEVRANLAEIDKIVDKFSKKLSSISIASQGSSTKVTAIKGIIKDMKMTNESFDSVKSKLMTLVESLDGDLGTLVEHSKDDSEIVTLKNKINTLEKELEVVKEESLTDQLTKLSNRKNLDEEIAKLDEYYERFGDEYSVVFFDIDKFKNINDTYGHQAGDTVLASFGIILKKLSRDIDVIGRWGGEEFVALLSKGNMQEAVKYANKIRTSVESTKFIYKEQRIPVTISAGVASRSEEKNMKDLIKLSDKRLYDAKNNGRNRVEPFFQ
jgi:diguanylate cyclase (GGDEF)-like protein